MWILGPKRLPGRGSPFPLPSAEDSKDGQGQVVLKPLSFGPMGVLWQGVGCKLQKHAEPDDAFIYSTPSIPIQLPTGDRSPPVHGCFGNSVAISVTPATS